MRNGTYGRLMQSRSCHCLSSPTSECWDSQAAQSPLEQKPQATAAWDLWSPRGELVYAVPWPSAVAVNTQGLSRCTAALPKGSYCLKVLGGHPEQGADRKGPSPPSAPLPDSSLLLRRAAHWAYVLQPSRFHLSLLLPNC